ncbi:N-acetyl-1-D-myo-inositol-2-amino-2-deoxy-alpha-D-glucopyranoside deacetylase [Corynebacterium aquilae]|uniref:1D-myo-inositol 2-acetamido-2-deoxy-alpha-D-glucopyranoside deacetylase n=1 Tax=Corynebacterium aquilae DSM 44791 TaxID=1431546 RepID=A0A1L7CF70_9CORY|nr:N-acetyl-1-D-myo-inositol-2-amino-2-deoxy-alpha-D-glucopyranoside deacetylase [Corynebacterium aquilae]APT84474.1 1D-myo-inositol 2-acetamido-2-deoxy-alpha-D-glucopyranoside deacetylase [Corynebacterium aquilae DSM 44791]
MTTSELAGLKVVAVHAHPDDEAIWTGGLLCDLARRGAQVTVVTCTLGEEGETIGPDLQYLTVDHADQLGGYRIQELAEAQRILGVQHRFLGGAGRFRDSGMEGSPAHADLRAFVNAGSASVDALDEILQEIQPQLIVTYGPDGGYGHPDHIAAHKIVHAAKYTPQRILWCVTSKPMIHTGSAAITAPAGWRTAPGEIACVDTWDVAHPLSPEVFDAKIQAMRAHATQVWIADGRPHPLGAGSARAIVEDVEAAPVVWALSNLIAQPLTPVEYYQLGAGEPLPDGANDVTAGLVV